MGAFCEPVYTFGKSPSPVIHSVFRVVNKQADHCEDEFSSLVADVEGRLPYVG